MCQIRDGPQSAAAKGRVLWGVATWGSRVHMDVAKRAALALGAVESRLSRRIAPLDAVELLISLGAEGVVVPLCCQLTLKKRVALHIIRLHALAGCPDGCAAHRAGVIERVSRVSPATSEQQNTRQKQQSQTHGR